MQRVFLDPGHGGTDPGARGHGLEEKDLTLDIARAAAQRLTARGLDVRLSRSDDRTVSLGERTRRANAWPADLFVSVHVNAGGGTGFESYVHPAAPPPTRDLRRGIHGHLAAFLDGQGFRDRGRKEADFYVLRETAMPAVLLECLFIDRAEDARWLAGAANRDRLGNELAYAVARLAGKDGSPAAPPGGEPGGETPILAPPSARLEQARHWASGRDAADLFVALADLYWRLAPERGGVDPAAAYAQSAKETAFGRFGGEVDPSYFNPCGLRTADGRGHQRFADWSEGVTAHLDHLALYAGAPGYPRQDTPDPRHFPALAGTAATVEALGGRWAPADDYGISIVRDYLAPLQATETPPGEEPAPWARQAWEWARAEGLLDGMRPGDPVTRQELAVVLHRLHGPR